MSDLSDKLKETFGGRLRVRVCGLYAQDGEVLMALHRGMGEEGLWLPPGGGVEYGESLEEALKREWEEETGMTVVSAGFLFLYEVIRPPYHALEAFFKIEAATGEVVLGHDPELSDGEQSLAKLEWMSLGNIKEMLPHRTHQLFSLVSTIEGLWSLEGYYRL